MALHQKKAQKLWVIKAVDRRQRRTIAWVLGNRNTATFRRLYDKVKHFTGCIFYTDDWNAFAAVLPSDRHIIGKSGTVTIEQDNSNTRHHLARFTRRTKVVSQKKEMVDLSLRLWCSLTNTASFQKYQRIATAIYK